MQVKSVSMVNNSAIMKNNSDRTNFKGLDINCLKNIRNSKNGFVYTNRVIGAIYTYIKSLINNPFVDIAYETNKDGFGHLVLKVNQGLNNIFAGKQELLPGSKIRMNYLTEFSAKDSIVTGNVLVAASHKAPYIERNLNMKFPTPKAAEEAADALVFYSGDVTDTKMPLLAGYIEKLQK